MNPLRPTLIALAGATLLTLALSGCGAARGPAPQVVNGQTFGTTTAPFRGRWWQLYERGVSWSLGGLWVEAEADFRETLTLRVTDNRRARTYGMHFVQCFVHRELGAVLIEQNHLDEAEAELRLSLAQEPSAKAEFLLARIATQRGVAAPALGAIVALPPPADPTPPQLAKQVVLEQVQPAADGSLAVSGRLQGLGGDGLVALAIDGTQRPVSTAPDGAFTVALKPGERLASAGGGEPAVLVTPEPSPPKPELTLDGPKDGAVVTGNRVWYRFSARASAGLTSLAVTDQDGMPLAVEHLAGIQAGGTFSVALNTGRRPLRFVLTLADRSELVQELSVTVVPTPEQDRAMRATAAVLPLQTPSDGAGVKPGDDPGLLSSVSREGRFRLIDSQADALLARELTLVDAGYVDRVTAAEAGRRLKTRYVLTGTLRRGRGDVECFIRLVHADSGEVVASADAYAQAVAPAQEQAFFALVAGRLRQEFPVLQATLSDSGGATIIDRGGNAGVVGRMRFFVVKRDADVVDQKTGEVLLPGEKRIEGTLEVEDVEKSRARLKAIDGKTAAGSTVVSE